MNGAESAFSPQSTGSSRQRRWPPEAHELVVECLKRIRKHLGSDEDKRAELDRVVGQLMQLTGKSRSTCWRFARRLGAKAKQAYKEWTRSDQQRLLDLISKNPLHEVAKAMHRSPGSVRAMLHRLGASAKMGRDWFTVYTLAEALHTRASEVQQWIDRGWLKTKKVETGRLTREIIDADSFTEFVLKYRQAIVGRRLNPDRLEFVRQFVFPPSHTDLLPVRESKKERAAFDAMVGKPGSSETDPLDSEGPFSG